MQELQGKQEEQIDEVGEECRLETIEPCHAETKTAEAGEMRIDPTKNTIVCGDNLKWLNDIPDESIDLCYIDPPFFSNATYEKVWGNGWEVSSFGDRFAGGIIHYIEWMRPRVKLIHSLLKPTGAIFLHCDQHASHRLRCLLDDIFDSKNFVNEIIWHYKRWPINGKYLQPMHDNIYYYCKDIKKNRTFNTIYGERTESTKKRWKENKIKAEHDKSGKRTPSKSEKKKSLGVPIDDVFKVQGILSKEDWDLILSMINDIDDVIDLPIIAPSATERIGYRTQKPEKLLKQLIEITSNDGDVVLDCFAGGFTTAKVCADLGRKFICGDVSPVACKVGAKRLNKAEFYEYEIKGMYQTEEEFRSMNAHEFADMICDLMGWKSNPKKIGDGGIDGWDGNGNPVQIKNWKRNAGAHDLRDFKGALEHHKTGVFVNWGFVEGKTGVYEYIQEQKQKHGINIEVRKCTELIGDLLIANEKK